MTLLYEEGSSTHTLSDADLKQALYAALDKLGEKKKVIIVPPDFTRFHSYVVRASFRQPIANMCL